MGQKSCAKQLLIFPVLTSSSLHLLYDENCLKEVKQENKTSQQEQVNSELNL